MTWVAKDGAAKVPRLRLGGTGAGAHPRLGTWPAGRAAAGGERDAAAAAAAAERVPRPQTATLERPRILDIAFLGKIDMTLTRKGFISISSLCLAPAGGEGRARGRGRRRAAAAVGAGAGDALPEAGRRREGRSGRARRGRRAQHQPPPPEPSPSPSPSPAARPPPHAPRRPLPAASSPSPAPSPARRAARPIASAAGGDARRGGEVNNNNSSSSSEAPGVCVRRKPRAPPPPPPPPRAAPRGRPPAPAALDAALARPRSGGGSGGGVPEPCTTCGRPEQPERFHSHPPTRSAARTAPGAAPAAAAAASPRRSGGSGGGGDGGGGGGERATKSSVRKPVPIKFRSGRPPPPPARPAPADAPAQSPSPVPAPAPAPASTAPSRRPGPRTVLCYLCGREFGSASLPLHEPHCLQRWQRENEQLPPHLRRAPPQRPAAPPGADEWNRLAWEASQARLVPCERCGRTFDPDRLAVHERSCRAPGPAPGAAPGPAPALTAAAAPAAPAALGGGGAGRPPPTVPCYICGRLFGSASIAIHEPQCMAKWRADNAQLPPQQRRAEPVKPEAVVQGKASRPRAGPRAPATPARPPAPPAVVVVVPVPAPAAAAGTPPRPRQRRFVPCHLCGRSFGTASIIIHERQCLERWKRENAALPPELRRPEPEKPDIVYKENGAIDYEGTMEAIWQTHLEQLVPCSLCGRTFYPDRLAVHARACKGPKR